MTVDLKAGIVRVLKPNGETSGTGFVTDGGLIVACAHVIAAAGAGPGDTVRIIFHTTGEEREAKVELEWWRAPDAEDVAILRLDGALPEEVTALPLGSSGGTSGHPFKTFGFPAASPEEGIWGDGHILEVTKMQGMQVLQLSSPQITPGFSGAPVWDERTRRVVGMVTAITIPDRYGRLAQTAFITPTETLRAVCPALHVSDICPYRSLDAFTEADAELFFGHERGVERLLDSLRREPRFLAVLRPLGQRHVVPGAGGAEPPTAGWGSVEQQPLESDRYPSGRSALPVSVTSVHRGVRWWPLILVALGVALLVPRIPHLEDETVWLLTVSNIFGVIATLVGFTLLGFVGREGGDIRLATLDQMQLRTTDFPFHIVHSTAELTNILLPDPTGKVPLPDRDVPYIPRDLPDLNRAFLEKGRVLLRGRSKTGKTRVVIELLRKYWRTSPTVLVLKRTTVLRTPTFVPDNLPHRNLVILIDDLHVHASACRRRQTSVGAALSDVVDFFVQHCGNQLSEVRLVAIARKEPECWQQIGYDPAKSPWREITLVDLPDLTVDDARLLVIELATMPPTPLRVAPEIADAIAHTNDGTFYHLILAFRDWRDQPNKREITAQDAASLQADLAGAWRHRQSVLFRHKPQFRYVYGALDLAQAIGLPSHRDLIAIFAQSLRGHLIVNIHVWATVGWKWVQRRFLGRRWIRGVDARIKRLNMKATVWLQGLLLWLLHRLLGAKCRSIHWFRVWTSLSRITFLAALTLVSFGPALIVTVGMLALYFRLVDWLVYVAPLVVFVIVMLMLFVVIIIPMLLVVLWAGRWISEQLTFLNRISFHRATRYLGAMEIPMVGSIFLPYDSQIESTAQAFSTKAWVSNLMQARDLTVSNHFLSSALQRWFDRADFDFIGWEVGACVGEVLVRLEPKNSSAHDKLGRCYLWQGQLDEAFSAFQRAIELDPDYAAPHNSLGFFNIFQGQHGEAIAAFQRAIELDPNNPAYHNNLGFAYIQLGQHDEAIAACRRARQLDPGWICNYINLGTAYEFLGQHEEAVASYWQAIRLAPHVAYLYKRLGNVYLVLDWHEEAIAAYQRAIELNPDDPAFHNDLGFVCATLGRHEEAIAAYQRAIELDSEAATLHSGLGNVYSVLSRHEDAIAAYQRAIELDPNVATFHINLGEAYRAQGRYDEALAAYHHAIELGADDALIHNNLGVSHAALGQHDEAIAAYQKAIELNPSVGTFHTNLGEAYRVQGRYDEALVAYHHAIALDADDALIHNNLGVSHAALGQHDEAIAAYRKATELDPSVATFHTNLGEAYRVQGRYDEALAAHHHAIALDADDALIHNNLGVSHAALDRHDEAIAAYQKAIELDPSVATFHTNLAEAYRAQGRYDEALVAYHHAIELGADDALIHNNLGVSHAALGQHDEAIAAYQKAIELNPNLATPHNNLGLVYHDLGQHDEAIAAYQRAVELDPDDAVPHNRLGDIYAKLGQHDEAITKYQKAVELDPNLAAPYNGLGLVYTALGRYDEAIVAFQWAIELDPKDAVPYKFLGLVCNALDRYEEAIATCQKAIELDPSHALPHLSLASVYRHMGEEVKWQYHLAQARRFLNPDNHYDLACLESITGDVETALDHLAKALEQAPINRELVLYDLDFAFIRDSPRFQELVGKTWEGSDKPCRPTCPNLPVLEE